eukprot:CAMPEP_0179041882 /NCGR_PEP_ID=MMETSP0796-20121207/16382_1 /TAXON_ID=73915 /ORGANISM="Pyrodinium bahamense, Strain pbaha01" /LENGTH=412 /DNA_ID=CAMNT_0020738253 /DNA_START=21 /DNA_END=1259 /DNA_ORIENTATION=+
MASHDDSTKSYRIKDIRFFGSARRILLQSANGPCPLLALCNVLLLRNQLTISQDARYISFAELVGMVSNHLFDVNAGATRGDSPGSRAANVRENLSSCLEILPKLNVGLDVNCKFGGVSEFEYTQELSVFDLLDICLYHGWVVSKQEEKAWAAFAHLSYNQVVERLIALEAETAQPRRSDDPEAAKIFEEGLLIQDFMERTASQLSYDGLLALHEAVRERQLAVFFRNSHFSTMLKYSGDLYLLCTDIAFGNSHIVWERLDEVDGDTSYCDADFHVNTAASDEAAALAAAEAVQESYLASAACMGLPQGADTSSDALLAWQMMQEDLQARALAQAQTRAQRGADGQSLAAGGGRMDDRTLASQSSSPEGGTIFLDGTSTAPGKPEKARGAPDGGKKTGKKTAKKSGKSCVVQ